MFDEMIGGQLSLTGDAARPGASGPYEMRMALEASSFTVKKAPIMARILSAASLPGLLNLLSSEGLKFTRLTATGKLRPEKLGIDQLLTHGGSLGLTASGEIAYETGEVEIEGTIIPIYGVNSILGKIPLVNLLVGGKGQGIVAMNYGLTGPLQDPNVSINPVSALTPGFLRGVFGLFKQEPGEDTPSSEFRREPNPPQKPPDSSDDGESG